MSQDPDHRHHVRRVLLPSGRSIEVVYFDPPEPDALSGAELFPADPPSVDEDLHVCPECRAGLVYPLEWAECSHTQWEVERRCPNCEWQHVGRFDQDVVDRFDDELDRGTATVVRDLNRLMRANMEEDIERFTLALDSDAVWPMDF